jgi:phospholipid/cholesterol/gamma-HCH transport system permease protein
MSLVQEIATDGPLHRVSDGSRLRLIARGDWVVGRAAELDAALSALQGTESTDTVIELAEIGAIDTTGAYLLARLRKRFEGAGAKARFEGLDANKRILFEAVLARSVTVPSEVAQTPPVRAFVEDTGAVSRTIGRDFVEMLRFFGAVVRGFGSVLLQPSRMRWTSVIHHIERAGIHSIPIICLMCFLIGAIVAQQGAFQLRRFGAEAFAAQLVAVLSLRELGVLLAAIMFAGRTGSAFTAELGSMKMREEIDALRVAGLDPIEVLVLPRILALVIALPLVTIIANFAALAGGAVTLAVYAGVEITAFIDTLQNGIRTVHTFVGVAKAPAMALMIGLVACFEGLRVQGSAESLGLRVTASVVTAIFMVIVLDGVFAVVFAAFGA